MSSDAPFSFFVALDGGHLDGLHGSAGLLRFDWPSKRLTVRHYPGVSAAHNISLSHDGRLGLLGNFSQQIVLVDTYDLRILQRVSTLGLEPTRFRLRSDTHHLWEPDDRHFLGAVGPRLYRFDSQDILGKAEVLGEHQLYDAHEIRWDKSRRWVLMGDLGAEREESRRISIFDTTTRTARVIDVPGTVWHVCVHPELPKGWAATYSIEVLNRDIERISPLYGREYIFEIDLEQARITRHWSCGAEFPIHLNSDLSYYKDEQGAEYLVLCAGGSHTVVEIPLAGFSEARVLEVRPPLLTRLLSSKQGLRDVWEAATIAPLNVRTDEVIQTLEVTRGSVFDGVYATRLSPDLKYFVVGHRGYNWLAIYDRRTLERVWDMRLPQADGYHLGMHHSEIQPLGDRLGPGTID
jgi:hypothetical protein